MHIQIRAFKGAADVDLTLDRLTILAGPNHSGKSSTIQAIAAALTGEVVPIPGLAKKDAGMLVGGGGTKSGVRVSTDTGSATVTWPAAKYATDGADPPHIGRIAAGLDSLADMTAAARGAALTDLLGAAPTRDDLVEAMKKIGLTGAVVDKVWSKIETGGWDVAGKQAADRRAEFKGRWEEVAGTRWGSKIADGWLPPGWTDDLSGADPEALQQAVTDARAAADRLTGAAAVSVERRARLQADADDLPARRAALDAAQKAEGEARGILEAKKSAVATMPRGLDEHALLCPHCAGKVAVTHPQPHLTVLEKATERTAAETKAIRAAYQKAEGEVYAAERDLRDRESVRAAAAAAVQEAERAAADLAALPADGDGPGAELEAAREAERTATARLTAFQKKAAADGHNANIAKMVALADILAPAGLRLAKLRDAITRWSKDVLGPLSAAAGWAPVEIDPDDASITYGRRPWVLLSESEQFRTRVVLQIATAQTRGDAVVLVDRADVLFGRGDDARPGRGVGFRSLLKLLIKAGVPAVVAVSAETESAVPVPVKAAGVAAYWIESGTAVPFGATQQEAA